MKYPAVLSLAAFVVIAMGGCASWTLSSFLPTMPETPEPEAAAPAATPSAAAPLASGQPNGLAALLPSPRATAAASPAAAVSPAAAATPSQNSPAAGATQTAAASGQKTPGSEWIGKTRAEVVKKLGMPLSAVPVDSTGGEMLFYSHYVFESAPGGFIVKVTPVN